MNNITLALAVLLGAGFLIAKLGQFLRLPSVTGYICAGFLLGPSGVNLLSAETIGHQLGHFTQIALMLIAFGIGEHLEIKRLRSSVKSLSRISFAEILGALFCVSAGCFLVAYSGGLGPVTWQIKHYVTLALLLGTVSVATAPAATMHVMRELGAAGPLTTTLMAVVAIDNGLAIMLFGVAMTVARQVMAADPGMFFASLLASLVEIAASLFMGIVTGLLIDIINSRLREKNEMLTVGLALLLLCGEGARMFDLSPLLAGMAAAFTIVNREHRDMRLFRALNAFEPPIYVLFFTLAGIHLNFSALIIAGWLGIVYFLSRSFGKIIGANIGARFSNAPKTVQKYLGLALTPQAGVAIGLIFLINDEPSVSTFSEFITPVVLAGVFLSELVGPVFARYAIKMAGEAAIDIAGATPKYQALDSTRQTLEPQGVPLVPWTWERLKRHFRSEGVVVFGANHLATAAALARMSAIFAHYFHGYPLAARIIPESAPYGVRQKDMDTTLLETAQAEVSSMGSELYTVTRQSDNIAESLISIANQTQTWAIVLGHSLRMTPAEFQNIIGRVIEAAPCPTIVIKFSGILHTEKILVPIVSMRELYILKDWIKALAAVGHHQLTLLRLLPSYDREPEVKKAQRRLGRWVAMEGLQTVASCKAVATEARQETIIEEARPYDLLIMAVPRAHGLRKFLFGSLANNIARKINKTLITVYPS